MCLYLMLQNKNNRKFKLTAPKSPFMRKLHKDGKVTCWKIYCNEPGSKVLFSVFYDANSGIKRPGIVKSDRSSKKLINIETKYETHVVYKGIHVYTTRQEALMSLKLFAVNHSIIIPVTCYKKDLVAQGSVNEAVFMQVTIEPKTWINLF